VTRLAGQTIHRQSSGDDVVFNDGFAATSITLNDDHGDATADAWDKNGNMILDGDFAYVYDAWNNLVAVKSQADADVVYATYRFFADDRRASKAVTHRGELDTTLYFLYDGPEVIEERDGSEAVVQQYVYGPRHIDDLAMIRGRNGTSFVHTDANWNVVGLILDSRPTRPVEGAMRRGYAVPVLVSCDVATSGRVGSLRDRLPRVKDGGYGDYDGDGDVDANDRGEITGLTCGGSNPAGACRVLNLDFDNDCDAGDETLFDSLPHTGTVIHRARRSSLLGQPFAHQGLFLDPEIGSYQNRARQYGPHLRRFVQRAELFSIRYSNARVDFGASENGYETSSEETPQLSSVIPRFESNDPPAGFENSGLPASDVGGSLCRMLPCTRPGNCAIVRRNKLLAECQRLVVELSQDRNGYHYCYHCVKAGSGGAGLYDIQERKCSGAGDAKDSCLEKDDKCAPAGLWCASCKCGVPI
jgi:hypothetical protein